MMEERVEKISERQFDAAHEFLHTNTDGMQELKVTADRPWLNQKDVVDSLVRNFASDVLRKMPLVGPAFPIESYINTIGFEAVKLNDLFLGYQAGETHPDYTRGVWNMPGNLGHWLSVAAQLDCEQRNAVRDRLMVLAADLAQIASDNDANPIADWGWMLDASIETVVLQLMGLQEQPEIPPEPAEPVQLPA